MTSLAQGKYPGSMWIGGSFTGELIGVLPTLDLDLEGGVIPADMRHRRQCNASYIDSDGILKWAPANLVMDSDAPSIGANKWSLDSATYIGASSDAPPGFSSSSEYLGTAGGGGIFAATGNRPIVVNQRFTTAVWVRYPNSTGTRILTINGQPYAVEGNTWQRLGFVSLASDTIPAFYFGSGGQTVRLAGAQVYMGVWEIPYMSATTEPVYAPRFVKDPANGRTSLFFERSSTNFALNSSCVHTHSLQVNGANAVNSGIDWAKACPDATAGLRKITVTTAGSPGTFNVRFGGTVGGTANFDYTGSCWIATADGSTKTGCAIEVNDSTGTATVFTATPTLTRVSGTGKVAGSYRFCDLELPVGTYYIWGVQLEIGADMTSYIATSATETTRTGDNLWVPPTRTLTSGACTLIGDFTLLDKVAYYEPILGMGRGVTTDVVWSARYPGRSLTAEVKSADTQVGTVNSGTYSPGVPTTFAISTALNNVVCARLGAIAGTPDTVAELPTGSLDRLGLFCEYGRNGSTTVGSSGYLRRVRVYPIATSVAQLQQVTAP